MHFGSHNTVQDVRTGLIPPRHLDRLPNPPRANPQVDGFTHHSASAQCGDENLVWGVLTINFHDQ